MIQGVQIIALVFALLMFYLAYIHYRRKEINKMEITIWTIIWIGTLTIILFPDIFNGFAKKIAIARAFDLAVIAGFIIVIPIVYLSYVRMNRLERKIERIVREESLLTIKRKKHKNKRKDKFNNRQNI